MGDLNSTGLGPSFPYLLFDSLESRVLAPWTASQTAVKSKIRALAPRAPTTIGSRWLEVELCLRFGSCSRLQFLPWLDLDRSDRNRTTLPRLGAGDF